MVHRASTVMKSLPGLAGCMPGVQKSHATQRELLQSSKCGGTRNTGGYVLHCDKFSPSRAGRPGMMHVALGEYEFRLTPPKSTYPANSPLCRNPADYITYLPRQATG